MSSARIGDLLKGVVAAAIIICILVWVPILLLGSLGFSYPEQFGNLIDPLTSNNVKASAALRLGLSMLAWLAWLQVAWALVVEILAAFRGQVAKQVIALIPFAQHGARRLVATAMLLFSLSAPVASATVPAAVAVAAAESADEQLEPSVVDTSEPTDDPPASATLDAEVDEPVAESIGDDGETADDEPVTEAEPGPDVPMTPVADLDVPTGSGGPVTVQPSATDINLDDYDIVDYQIKPGDTFWSVAEQSAGNGLAWRQIRRMNVGVMNDGLNLTERTDSLTPGWVIKVPVPREVEPEPVEAAGNQTESGLQPSSTDGVPAVEVDEGDHFWKLATQTLSDAWGRQPTEEEVSPYWVDMVAANGGRLLPPEDPDMVYPGQWLEVPPVPNDPNTAAAEASRASLSSWADGVGGERQADPAAVEGRVGEDDADGPTAEQLGTITSTYATAAGGGIAVDGADGAQVDDFSGGEPGDGPLDEAALAAATLAAFGLLSAGVARIVDRRQLREMGSRRPGTAPVFQPPLSAEELFAGASDDDALSDLDLALRHLGLSTERHGMMMPEMVGALVNDGSIRFLMADRYESAPPPFEAARGGMIWRLTRPIPPLPDTWAANPYPSLVSVGYTADDRLLVDLEYVQALHLDGNLSVVVDSMATMALELATSPLADTVEVICVGFGEELAELERVTVAPDLASVLPRVERHAAMAVEIASTIDLSAAGGRAAEVGDWTPMVVLDPLGLHPEETQRLVAAANSIHGGGVSAVVTDPTHTGLTMEVGEGRVAIPAYRVKIDRRAMTSAQRAEVAAAVSDATAPDIVEHPDLAQQITVGAVERRRDAASGQLPPVRPVQPFNDGPGSRHNPTTMAADPAQVRYTVKLLGPLRVVDATGHPIQFDRSSTPEFIAYLAHHRAGTEVSTVMNALWPSTTARRPWINNVFADARRCLGSGADGVSIMAEPGADDRYVLSPMVGTDLDVFVDMVAQAERADMTEATELLIEALELVDGIPYANITSRWPRQHGFWHKAALLVDEAARSVAALALDQFDDPSLAEWAAARGLLANPYSVELHRLRLRAAIASGSSSNVDAVFQHYQTTAMSDDHRPEGHSQIDPDIIELYESFRRSQISELA